MYAFEDKFTDEEIDNFKEAFMFFDKDGDGSMNNADLGLGLRAVGLLVTNQEVEQLIKKFDPDNSGTIDVNDYLSCIAELVHKADNLDEIRGAFAVFDKEDNGMLNIDEMRHVLTRIGDRLTIEELLSFV